MVVIPTEEDVVLEFARGWAEKLGMASTFLVGSGLIVFAVRKRRRRSGVAVKLPDGPLIGTG
jgi:hypothetical protein